MKQYLTLTSFLIISLIATSCTDSTNDYDSGKLVKPGVYYIDMNLNTIHETETKGVVENNDDFDNQYTPDEIYLHYTTTNGENINVKFPVYECEDCLGNKAVRYRICKLDDGTVRITPIDAEGKHVEEENTKIDPDGTFYFSSWRTNDWALSDQQIEEKTSIDNPDQTYNFFYRTKDTNQEIYRSRDNFTLSQLTEDGNLIMVRACAGFSLVGFFYDVSTLQDNPEDESGQGKKTTLTPESFESIMGSPYTEWYIKIYIGGTSFTNSYDIGEQTSTGEKNGYYSSGDAGDFQAGELVGQEYLPLQKRTYGDKKLIHAGIGYYTYDGNNLFTPIATNDQLDVYILIKHWTQESDQNGSPGNPSKKWLNSDLGALQTKLSADGTLQPNNNNFYTTGLLMDIHEFQEAWDASGGDSWQQGTSTVSTKSPSGATVREFTLKDAKVIFEAH